MKKLYVYHIGLLYNNNNLKLTITDFYKTVPGQTGMFYNTHVGSVIAVAPF